MLIASSIRNLAWAFLLICGTSKIAAQSNNEHATDIVVLTTHAGASGQRLLRNLSTNKVMKDIRENYYEYLGNQASIERQFQNLRNRSLSAPKKLPLVFHIVYHDEKERVGMEQVMRQIDALNRDFNGEEFEASFLNDVSIPAHDSVARHWREKFSSRFANPQISFCLARANPDGNLAEGVNYVRTDRISWTDDHSVKFAGRGGAAPWNTAHYINVWVCRLDDAISGYAQMPGGPPETDGIVVDYRYFGLGGTAVYPYDEGKTLTHLIGNYLNLYEIWGDGTLCSDDYADDTPIHNAPNYECPHLNHVSTCDDGPAEMVVNFMDNTDDACMYMFTAVQVSRMHAVLSEGGWRERLLLDSPNGCNVTIENDDFSQQIATAVGGNRKIWAVTLRPNPAQDAFDAIINAPEMAAGSLVVLNSTGDVIFQETATFEEGQHIKSIDCANWPSGLYRLRFAGNGMNWSKTISIAR